MNQLGKSFSLDIDQNSEMLLRFNFSLALKDRREVTSEINL